MKYEIIHLSDFHVKDTFDYENLVDKTIESILFENVEISDTIFLCITGDIAFSGQRNQYKLFDRFLEKLSGRLEMNNKKIEILIVPGNHDISLNKEDIKTRHDKIRDALDNNDFENELNNDIYSMTEFFNFSKKYNCFCDDKFVSIREFELDGHKLKFNLLNTACFSSIIKDDKDQHYISPEIIDQISHNNEINITLMHHSHEWFDEKCQINIETLCKQSTFYLLGHSHKVETIKTEDGLGFMNTEMKPTEISKSKFFVFLLDIENDRMEQFKVEYDCIEEKFIRKNDSNHINIYSRIMKSHNPNNYHNFKEINSRIDVDNELFDLNKVFVFPLITTKENYALHNYEELLKFIYDKKIIIIDGFNGCGKTTLSKRLFTSFLDTKKTVLFVNDLQLITNNYNQSIKNIFINNYSKRSFDAFLQQKKTDKIIIFDSVDLFRSEKTENFVKQCILDFDIVIISSNRVYGTRKDIFSESLLIDAEKIKIEPFSRIQRRKMVENFSKIYKQEDKIEAINNCVESTFVDETFVNLSTPDNLSILIHHIIKEKYYEERDTRDSFSIVFENNMINKLKKCVGDKKVEGALILLREIAYFMFNKEKSNCYSINTEEVLYVFNKCKDEWNIEIGVDSLFSFLVESKIMKLENNVYSFAKNSYFSYFIAKYIVDGINSGEERSSDINKLLESITFGNYSDVLLFIAYFHHSSFFFEKIIFDIQEITKSWTKISFDTKNHYILNRITKDGFIVRESFENKNQYNERRDKQEREYLLKKENQTNEKVYSQSDTEKGVEEILKITKLIEILSKGISGYQHIINKSKRKKMLNVVIDSLFKVIYKLFDLSDEEYEEIYNIFKEIIREKYPEMLEKEIEKKITNMFYDLISTFSLNLITGISNIFITKNSIEIIDFMDDKNENDELIFDNVLLKCICYERYGNDDKFINYVIKINNDLKSYDQKNMIKRIVYHFIVSKGIKKQNIEKLCSCLEIKKEKILSLNPQIAKLTRSLTNNIGFRK